MQLSIRLNAVASMVTVGNRLVEAGCDHAYMPIYLVENNIVPSAIAMDINKGPLSRAREHIIEHKLEDRIQTRLSDGISALEEGEGDSLIIAGMGGGLVMKILSEGENVLKGFKEIILQPQSEIEDVRRFLQDNGYKIIEEKMVIDEGKYYPMFKAIHGEMSYDRTIYFKYGKILLESKNEVLYDFLNKELKTYSKILKKLEEEYAKNLGKQNISERKKEIENELKLIKESLNYYEKN